MRKSRRARYCRDTDSLMRLKNSRTRKLKNFFYFLDIIEMTLKNFHRLCIDYLRSELLKTSVGDNVELNENIGGFDWVKMPSLH